MDTLDAIVWLFQENYMLSKNKQQASKNSYLSEAYEHLKTRPAAVNTTKAALFFQSAFFALKADLAPPRLA